MTAFISERCTGDAACIYFLWRLSGEPPQSILHTQPVYAIFVLIIFQNIFKRFPSRIVLYPFLFQMPESVFNPDVFVSDGLDIPVAPPITLKEERFIHLMRTFLQEAIRTKFCFSLIDVNQLHVV